MWEAIKEIVIKTIQDVLHVYGLPGLVIIFLFFISFYLLRRYINLSDSKCSEIIALKDKEIQRLVDERNMLQGFFLEKRLSSKSEGNNNG